MADMLVTNTTAIMTQAIRVLAFMVANPPPNETRSMLLRETGLQHRVGPAGARVRGMAGPLH